MTQEERFFIEILSDHINKKATVKPATSLNWHALSRLARIHQVDGIVYHQCKDFIPAEYKASFERGYSAALYTYANRVKEVQNIRSAFQKAGIQYYTIKGLDIAQFYPIPSLRTMGDSDFIVSDMPAAVQVMKSLGYDGKYAINNHQWGCKKDGLYFELHDLLVRENECATKKQARYFRNLMPHVKDNTLDWNYHYLYLLMHLRKHFMFSGVGIRQFMDLAVITKYGPALNWIWTENQLAKLELSEFAHVCYFLLKSCFGIATPKKTGNLPISLRHRKRSTLSKSNKLDETELIEEILRNGVFGFGDENNLWRRTKSELIKKRVPMRAKQALLILSCIFPGYDIMVSYPGCGFLEKRKYLLPAAWLRRCAYLIHRKDLAKAKKTIRTHLAIGKTLTEHAESIKKIGL